MMHARCEVLNSWFFRSSGLQAMRTSLCHLSTCGLLTLAVACPAVDLGTIASPDGAVVVTCALGDGHATYRIDLAGAPVLLASPLGCELSRGDLTSGLSLVEAGTVQAFTDTYDLATSKRSHISVAANQRRFTFGTAEGGRLSVEFRVSADGVAFRYGIPVQPDGAAQSVMVREATGFSLPAAAKGWLHPMHRPGGWSNTQPSYESPYEMGVAAGTPSPHQAGWCFPALFKAGSAGWLLVSEAGTDGGYCAMRLAHDSTGGVYRIAFPDPGENRKAGDAQPTIALPFTSPWRVVQVARGLGGIVTSTLATDVVGPARVQAAAAVRPGRAAWSWLVQNDASCNYDNQIRFIDMAADLGWEYVLVDAQWDRQIGRERMRDLAAYAAQHHVALWLWYNSNGGWNDAPQTPKNRMDAASTRQAELQWLKQLGIVGIKVDFFGGDKQVTMRLYEDLIRDAAVAGLMVNLHGSTLPRGWNRLYPNLMTAEAVAGMEMVSMNQKVAETEAVHASNLVFTRNVVAPMDYTPCVLQERMMNATRRTSRAFELALPVLFQSGVTHFGVCPDNLREMPTFVSDYLRAIPRQWDDLAFIAGEPGKYAVLARRSGTRWFIAGIEAEQAARTVTFTPDFLTTERNGVLLTAGEDLKTVVRTPVVLSPHVPCSFTLHRNSGFVIDLE